VAIGSVGGARRRQDPPWPTARVDRGLGRDPTTVRHSRNVGASWFPGGQVARRLTGEHVFGPIDRVPGSARGGLTVRISRRWRNGIFFRHLERDRSACWVAAGQTSVAVHVRLAPALECRSVSRWPARCAPAARKGPAPSSHVGALFSTARSNPPAPRRRRRGVAEPPGAQLEAGRDVERPPARGRVAPARTRTRTIGPAGVWPVFSRGRTTRSCPLSEMRVVRSAGQPAASSTVVLAEPMGVPVDHSHLTRAAPNDG
jgi:hypothetical protein